MITILKVTEANASSCFVYYTIGENLYFIEIEYQVFADYFGLFNANLEIVADLAEQYISDIKQHEPCDHPQEFYNEIINR